MAGPEGGATAWSRRYQANLERLRSGQRSKISDVVRELGMLERHHDLTAGERRMLRHAQQLLAGPPDGGNGTAVR